MRRQQRTRRRSRSRRSRRGGTAFVGKAYGPTTWGTSNHYAYNKTPKLEHPLYTYNQRGGSWTDMFDQRMRPIQPVWSTADSVGYGVKSGVHAFMGKYPPVNPNHLMGHFQK